MKYDDLLVELGEFGRYQKFLYFLVCLVALTSAFHSMNMVFVGPVPDHHCKLPHDDGLPAQWQNLTDTELKNVSIPWTLVDGRQVLDQCQITSPNDSELACTEWWYSKEHYNTTIVSEWDLVCSKSWLDDMSSTIFFLGRLVGALLSGPLADKFGRRPVFFCSIVAQVVLGCAAAASPTLWFFYGVYFLQGCVQVSVYLTSFVLGTELVGPRYRKNAGMCKQFFYSGGQIILTGLAFWLRKWRYILVVISLAPMLFFSYYWLLPESVRWLLAKGRKEEAEKIIKKTAYYNKVTLDDNIIDQLDLEEEKNTHKTYTFIDILRTATIAKIAVNVWFIWFVNALIYYGLSLNSSKLHGDPYLNFLFLACVEIPAVALCIPLLDRVGRRYLMLIFMLIGAVGCFGTAIFLGHPYLPVVFSTMGKFGITASYAIIYLFTAEVFPTVLRNNGIGIASVCARIAGIVAPLCLRLSVVWSPLSMVVFGAVSTIGGLCCLILPETTGKPLTQDIEEMKIVFNLERNNIHSGDKMKSVEEVDKLNNPVAA